MQGREEQLDNPSGRFINGTMSQGFHIITEKSHCGPTWTGSWEEVNVRHTIHNVVIVILDDVLQKHNKQRQRQTWEGGINSFNF